MKTIVCTILSLFTVTIVCGQKIVINEVDKFTGCKIVETSVLKTSRPNVDYKLRTFNDTLYICASVKNQSIRAKENDRSKLYLLIENKESLILLGIVYDAQEHEHRFGVHWGYGFSTGSAKILTDCEFMYQVPDEILALLCANDITDIRISVNDDNIDSQVDAFIAKRFRKLFNLMK